jgi:hypothetical protein
LISSIAAGSSDYFDVQLNATTAGTYAGDISIPNNDSNENPYNFRITGTATPVGTTSDSYEASGGDDTPATAKIISNGQTQNRSIHTAGNVDWIKFTVGGSGTANLVLETDGVSGDTQMWLYGPNTSSTLVLNGYNDDEGNGAFSRLACGVNGMPATLSPGTYYVKITEYNNDGAIAAYTLRAAWTDIGTSLPDSYEAGGGDDTPATAKIISNGQTQNRNIHAAGNVDWIKFTVGGSGTANLVLETDGVSGDTQMWLYGPNNSSSQVTGGYNDDKPSSWFSRLACGVNGMPATLSPGTYYIKITEYQNDGTIAAYTLRATWTEIPIGGGITDDAYETDNTPGASKTISNGQTQNRNIHLAGNEDWIKFTVGANGANNVVIETDGTSGDTQIWLFGPNNSSQMVPGGYNDDTGANNFSRLATGVNGMPATLAAGTYYIKIVEYQNDGTIAAYTLRASWTDLTTPIQQPDAYEADDTSGASKTISNGQTQNRNIHAAGNVDWIKFTVGGGGAQNVRIETDGASGDTQMWLFGPNSGTTPVAGGFSDDDGNGAFSLLVSGQRNFPATLQPGTYYIKVQEYQNDGTIPAYTLKGSWTESSAKVDCKFKCRIGERSVPCQNEPFFIHHNKGKEHRHGTGKR